MKETLFRYRDQAIQYWNQFSKTSKWLFISIIVITILTIALLVYNFSKTEYSNAFVDLNPDDAAAITNYLKSANINYTLSNDGTAIGVPTKQAAEVKIAVESQGLMKNGSLGYGIFKENLSSFGMTDNQFNVLNLDAKAGEIQQLIRKINGVSDSKVLINMPEESAFLSTNDKEQATASVVVTFKLGQKPDQLKIDTIYNLVSHSIPNLPIENITISDQNGELLPSSKSNGGLDNAANIVSQQFQIKKQYESDIQKNVQQFLARILGSDKVVVSVVSNLNFDKKTSEEKLVTPANTVDQEGIKISMEEIQKSYNSDGGDTSGTPGTGSTDIPGYPAGSSSGKSQSEESQKKINWDVNRITNSIVSSPYVVKDLTIFAGIEPPNPTDPNSLTQETRDEIQKILVNIVGASLSDNGQTFTPEELSNKVTVIARTFEGKPVQPSSGILSNSMLYWLGAAILALLALVGFLLYRRRKTAQQAAAEDFQEPVKTEFPTVDLESVNNESQVRKQLETLAKRKPEEFVNLLRTWLVDE